MGALTTAIGVFLFLTMVFVSGFATNIVLKDQGIMANSCTITNDAYEIVRNH